MGNDCVLLQITAGRGPAECCWAVAQVVKTLITEFKKLKFPYEVLQRTPGPEPGTLYSAVLQIKGPMAKTYVESWQGTLQWIGKSHYRKYHKRKNWFVGVSVLDRKNSESWKESELEYQTFRASGPGGQHVNKTNSAVRLLHKPTGLSVTSSDSRSQHQNKKMALQRFTEVFEAYRLKKFQEQAEEQWKEHLTLQRGNPVKVFKGKEFKEVST
ncbi:peptide chain release factor H [Rapidithrix thailandica]|uniref:Peptide chain release factor H n=1 Tax=Rapidithrix thailandica TaxID=413964 RepID=A0AAW9SFZ9_9BACT